MPMQQRKKGETQLEGLTDEQGKWCENESELEKITVDYFRKLFKSQKSCPSSRRLPLTICNF